MSELITLVDIHSLMSWHRAAPTFDLDKERTLDGI